MVLKCVTKSADRQIKFEKDPENGEVRKVVFITHRQKCADFPSVLKLEENEENEEEDAKCDCKIVETEEEKSLTSELDTIEDDKSEETTTQQIREHMIRYMKGII